MLQARRRIGELSAGLGTSKGGANPAATLPTGGTSKTEALKSAGLTRTEAHCCEQLARVPERTYRRPMATA